MCPSLLSVAVINAVAKSCLPACFPWIAQLLFLRSPGPPAHSGWSLWHQFAVKNLLYRHAHRSVPWRGSSAELPYSQMCQAESWGYNSDSTSEMLGKEKTGEFAVKTEVVQHGLGPANESGSRRLLKVKELRSEPSEKWERGCLGNLL